MPMNTMKYVGFGNYTRILKGSEFPKVLRHTFTYLALYLPLILLTSVGEALILNKSFKGTGCFAPSAIRLSSLPGLPPPWCGNGC